MNLMKLSKSDFEQIPKLGILTIYRRSLKLIRTYPSATKEEMKKVLLIEYREGKDLQDEDEIKSALEKARGALSHLYSYELKRREFLEIEDLNYKLDHPFQKQINEKLEKEKFEYF